MGQGIATTSSAEQASVNGSSPQSPGSGAATTSSSAPVDGSQQAELMKCLRKASELDRQRAQLLQEVQQPLRTLFGPQAKVAQLVAIGERLVVVLDGIMPDDEVKEIFRCLQSDTFRCTEFARPDTREFRHHVTEYNVERFRRTPLYPAIEKAARIFFPRAPESRLEVYRAYTNAILYGDVGFVHKDSNKETHVTALLYPNPEWSSELGGETVFYAPDGTIAAAVEPRAGRVVLFHGIIPHKGSPPSRLFFGSRYTTAFKFAPTDEDYFDGDAERGASLPRLSKRSGDAGPSPA